MSTRVKLIDIEEIKKDIKKIDTDLLLIIVDTHVWQIYGKKIEEALPKEKKFILYKSIEGEATKCMKEFERGLDFFLEKGVHRGAHLIAIGGGATSDYGGFIAASILRGISWSIIPTTLLSMVDASIGGKTGINSKHGKNLIGAFHEPHQVWIDEGFLSTLCEGEIRSGVGEIIKYCFLSNRISGLVEKEQRLSQIIKSCAQEKEKIVLEDYKERGVRKCLNLGHTFGHALERIYDLTHGEAIFWGMSLIFKLYQNDGIEYLSRLRNYSKKLNVDYGEAPWLNKTFPTNQIMEYLKTDKKKTSQNMLEIIRLKKMGDFESLSIELCSIEKDLKERENELRTFSF